MAEAFSSKVIMSPMNAHFYMLIVQVMDPVLPPTCVSFGVLTGNTGERKKKKEKKRTHCIKEIRKDNNPS